MSPSQMLGVIEWLENACFEASEQRAFRNASLIIRS